MATFEFLLTALPSLPDTLGDKVSVAEAYSLIKSEESTKINYLVDILSVEDEINKCGLQYYVLQNKDYEAQISESLPDSFKDVFNSYKTMEEATWMTAAYKAWFDMLVETSKKTGSNLLVNWAKWEYSLRIKFMLNRLKKTGDENPIDESTFGQAYEEACSQYDLDSIVEAYNKTSEPMKAEKALDQSRLDFIRSLAISYSFSADELVAYILELRIYARYARLSPEEGRKILQEVTAL